MDVSLADKIVFLAGASGGIGSAFLEHLVDEAAGMATACRSPLEHFFSREPVPAHLLHVQGDLTVEADVTRVFDQIRARWGRLDVMINCVGGSLHTHPLETFPVAEFDEVVRVNLRSAFLLTREAIKLVKRNPAGGNLVHLVSAAVKRISTGKGPYGIAKAGVARLIQYAAAEAAEAGVRVNGIAPNYVFTSRHEREITAKAEATGTPREALVQHIFDSQRIRRKMMPTDLLPAVRLLATTDVITGQVYNVAMGQILDY